VREAEPLSPPLQKLIRIANLSLIGAALGFACAVVILAAPTWIWSDAIGPPGADIWWTAFSHGALFGAISYPLARLTLLEKENQVNATIAVCAVGVVFGLIAFRLGGPSIAGIAAPFGFWAMCALIYQRRMRDRNRSDFGSYFR
jgi:hypothetical protein